MRERDGGARDHEDEGAEGRHHRHWTEQPASKEEECHRHGVTWSGLRGRVREVRVRVRLRLRLCPKPNPNQGVTPRVCGIVFIIRHIDPRDEQGDTCEERAEEVEDVDLLRVRNRVRVRAGVRVRVRARVGVRPRRWRRPTMSSMRRSSGKKWSMWPRSCRG